MAPKLAHHSGLNVRLMRTPGMIVLACVACYALVTAASPSSPARGPYSGKLFFAADTDLRDTSHLPFSIGTIDTSDTTRKALRDSLARRDSLRTRRRFLTPEDSLRALMDSTFNDTTGEAIDTTWVVYLDSTARMQQLLHHRADAPAADIFPKREQSLYAPTRSPALQREFTLDSTGRYVTIRQTVNGLDVKVPVTLTLDEYIQRRYDEEKINNWRTFTREYTIKQNRDELGNLLGSLTNIEIPVPANPLLSIFGKNVINIKVSGGVDIRGAYRSSKSDQVSQYSLDVARGEPDFNQQVQINVNGTVGDKLNILADWNTQRTFEYENQLKIKYTGYDDEIVQSVEAGNVSLQTPSLVGGGQALFGIKAKFQVGPLTLTSLLSQKKGQTKEISVSGGSQSQETPIQPWQYSKSYYFLDTVYAQFWASLHQSQTLTITPAMQQNQVVQIDVYQSLTSNPLANQNRINANAYIDLDPLPTNGRYTSENDSLMSLRNTAAGRAYKGYFIRLDPNKDYKFVGSQTYGGYIVLNTNVTDDQAIAVRYITAGPDGIGGTADDIVYGPRSEADTTEGGKLLLKLIKPQFLLPSYEPAWNLQLKNIYGVGGRDLKPEGFELRVVRRADVGADVDQIEGFNLLNILGVDRFDGQNQPNPDSRFDFIPGLTVDLERAEIIFPTLRPFDTTIKDFFRTQNKTVDDQYLFPEVYDTTLNAAQYSPKNKYVIYIKSSTSVSARYPLGFNVVEGSVVVLLNGIPLVPNTDYTVDYIVGEVVIRNPAALAPGANVQVKYEQNDLFQLASKTLIGARGELDLFPNTKLGFTAMNLNQATLSDKVRLGEEPTNNLIVGVDGATSFDLPFLTGLIDDLPFYRTKEMSNIRFSGEAAYSLPDPNTKKSTIPSDGGASIAYIDDFEGARRTLSIDELPEGWRPSSAPVHTLWGDGLSPQKLDYSKGRLRWYNNTRDYYPVEVTDIWPNRQVRRGEDFVSVLWLDYDPNHRAMYNFSPNLDSTLHRRSISGSGQRPTGQYDDPTLRRNNWNGIMRYVGQTAGSILEQNITYLEIWMQVFTPNGQSVNVDDMRRGRLYVDLGRVSEDVIPDNFLNSEATIRTPSNPGGIPVNVVTAENDLGLDMLSDAQEQSTYAGFLASNQGDPDVNPADPSADNFEYSTGQLSFAGFNGTENNRNRVPIPNTEDLNNNGNLDASNSYVEYAIPLDTLYYTNAHDDSLYISGSYVDSLNGMAHNSYIVGGGRLGWYQFRVPLLQAARVIGAESERDVLQNVQFMRLWVSGFAEPISIRIAEMGLVGNQWLSLVKDDSLMKISVVNIEDNAQYTSPPGVIRERDRTQPDQIIQGNEQSLDLVLQGLPLDSSRQAVKYFPTRPLDLFNYKSMKMFVHGDPAFSYFDPANYDAEVFIRFGADTANYYEYRQPVHPGWDPQNEVNVIFSELTSIKAARDSIFQLVRIPAPSGPPGSTIGIRGNPSLRQIRYMGIGVVNPLLTGKSTFTPLYGEIWVNELRLVDVDNDPGYAYRFDTQIKLADLGGVAFNYSKTSPTFHGLEARFGDQTNRTGWAMNANLDLSKFFPDAWAGTQVPVAYSHSENLIRPKYLPNTDVVVDEAAARAAERPAASAPSPEAAADKVRTESQTLHVQDSYSLSSFRVVWPTQKWYIRDTFSKLTFGFNYNRVFDRDPAFEARRTWAWNLRMSYGVNLPADLYIQPFKGIFSGIFLLDEFKDWKIYYMPIQSVNAGIGAQRSRVFEQSRSLNTAARETRSFGAAKNIGFAWKLTEGGLTNLTGDYSLAIDRNLLPQDNDSVGRDFSSIFKSIFFGGQDNRYSQNVKVNLKPKIPNIFDITKYLNLNAGYGAAYAWQNAFQSGDLGKSAGVTNNINLGMDLRLKSLVDPWFADDSPKPDKPIKSAPRDSTKPDEKKDEGGKSLFGQLKMLARVFIKIPFLDYDNININFTQTNRVANSGVLGSTGFQNFWGRLPFQGSTVENGPSRLYQLGIMTDPSGTLDYSPSSSFPFIGWKTIRGPRAANAALMDQFGQTNSLAMRTNRPLWTGATLEINWKVGWTFTKSTSFQTDSLGLPYPGRSTTTTAGGVERSFLSLPPVLMFKVFRSNLEDVGKKYDRLIDQGEPQNVALAQSFENGLEALPFLNRLFGQFVPRPNWTLRWDGIERVGGLNSIFDRLTLEHAYSSTFRRDFRGSLTAGGGEETYAERVQFGFAPLASINATFKQFLKGNFSGSLRMNSTTTYDLNLSANNITETQAQEMVFQVTYSRRGFKLPLFGLSLSNDVDISASYSLTKNTRRLHDPRTLSSSQEGTPLDGNTRTTMEPRIQYVLSSRVRAALYYRYTRLAPDEGGSTTFGTTTNEAGLDLHISI